MQTCVSEPVSHAESRHDQVHALVIEASLGTVPALTGSMVMCRWTRQWTSEENRHGDLMNKYCYLTGRVNMRVRSLLLSCHTPPGVRMHWRALPQCTALASCGTMHAQGDAQCQSLVCS